MTPRWWSRDSFRQKSEIDKVVIRYEIDVALTVTRQEFKTRGKICRFLISTRVRQPTDIDSKEERDAPVNTERRH